MKKRFALLLLFLPIISMAGGQEIYVENCEKCHGFSQQGSLGLPLYKSTIANHSDRYLKRTIKHGRPGRVMPGFNLSDAQVAKLIRFLRAGAKAPKYDTTTIVGDVSAGQYTYEQYCSWCHGANLEGGEGIGKNFSWQKDREISPPSLSNSGFLYAASDQMIKHIILNGIKDTEMVSYAKEYNFTSKMADDLVAFIRSHQNPIKEFEPLIDEPVSFVFQSSNDFDTTVKKVTDSTAAYNFRVYPQRTLLEGLGDPLPEDNKQIVLRFCNFRNMQKFLKLEPRLGIILPCRITIVEQDNGEVNVIMENYKYAIRRFNNSQMIEAADALVEEMKEMIEEALW